MNKEEILQKKNTLHYLNTSNSNILIYALLTSKINFKKKLSVIYGYAAIKNSDTNTDVVNTSITAFVCN